MKTPMKRLVEHLEKTIQFNLEDRLIIDNLLEKEKQEIIEARVHKDCAIARNVLKWDEKQIAGHLHIMEREAEQYYNERFKQ